MAILLFGMAVLSLVGFGWLHLVSRSEHELLAMRRSAWAALLTPLFFVALAWLPLPGWIPLSFLALILAAVVVLMIPTGSWGPVGGGPVSSRVDERTIMFSRAALEPGTPRFQDYYSHFPEHRAADDRFRLLPGLMSRKSGKFEPLSFAAAAASFLTVEQLASLVQGDPATEITNISPAAATGFIKGWLKKLGAVNSGVTLLQDHHLYTVKGRGRDWGRPIDLRHRWAIAFAVEMDHGQVGTAPEGPTLMESAEQYLHAGALATQVAVFIRKLGWEAEAHIDAHYKVICPLVAKDAGLGEIGRLGLLMTPELGPRVRLGVVTTNLPLVVDEPCPDPTVLHFCSICRKCADICPPGAIPKGAPELVAGSRRWRLDSEACFTYWCAMGTDCGQCLRVCPYSHPDTLLHRLVRRGLSYSALIRHLAVKMDDWLYGRRPGPNQGAPWSPPRS